MPFMAEIPTPPPRKLILDTDPGIDDALAMAMLAGLPGLELLAITTVFGNADVALTTRNALFLRDRLQLAVPLHQGAATPLSGVRGRGAAHVHGLNGLGDIAVPAGSGPDGRDAAGQIAAILRAHPGQVTVLAIGPLTNLALALRRDPGIAGLAAGVVVMGGAFGTGGRWGNVTQWAEANFHNDPAAAAAVLAAPWPVTLVGLDVTMRCILSNARAARLAGAGATGRLLWELSRFYAAAYARYDGLDGCCLHDVAAVAALVAPSIFTGSSGTVTVVQTGDQAGHCRLLPDPAGRHHVCWTVDADSLVDLFLGSVTAVRPALHPAVPAHR